MGNPNRARKIGKGKNPARGSVRFFLDVTDKDLAKEGPVKKVLRKNERYPFTPTKIIRRKITWDLHGVFNRKSVGRAQAFERGLRARGLKTAVAFTKDGTAIYAR